MASTRLVYVAFAALVLPVIVERVLGQTPAPPREHAERLTFDEKTGRWVRTPDPVPGTEDGDLDIARQWLAREDYAQALEVVDDWIDTYGEESLRHPEALYVKATAHLELGDYRAANETYQKLLDDYPGSEYAERALSGEFRVAEQYLAGKRRKALWGLLRVRDREGGIKIMDDIMANYSDTPLAEAAQLSKAEYYYSRGEFELAEDEFATFAGQFPNSRYHQYALLQSARSALASFPGVKFDDAALVEAQERFGQFRRLYPEASQQQGVPVLMDEIAAKRAEKSYDIGRFYERTGQHGAARYYYRATVRRWPGTPAGVLAENRLVAMGEPSISPPAPLPVAPAPQEDGQ